MNPPAAIQRPAAGPASPPRRRPRTPFVLGAVAVVAAIAISQLLASPHFVSNVTLVNRTGYGMLVEVSNGHGDGWLPLGTVDRHDAVQFGQVFDVGDQWTFRVTSQTDEAGTFRLTRAQLEQSNWRVQIPQRIGDALQRDGVEPQP